MPTHYEVLGVDPSSEPEVIEAAYKALMRKYHPDRVGDNERVRKINAAYEVLRSSLKRKAYDAALKVFPAREIAKPEPPTYRRAEQGHQDKQRRQPSDLNRGNPRKRCHDCGEEVAGSAQVCRFCGFRFHNAEAPKKRSSAGVWALIAVPAVVLLVAGLSSPTPEEGEIAPNQAASVLDWLKEGSAEVCSDPEVQMTAIGVFTDQVPELKSGFEPILEKWKGDRSSIPIRFEAISMTGKNFEISEVSCQANLRLDGNPVRISYNVRPTLDKGAAYVVEAETDSASELVAGLFAELVKLSPSTGVQRATGGAAPTMQEPTPAVQPFPYIERGQPGRELGTSFCDSAEVGEGGYVRDDEGEIVVRRDGLCRTATRAEAQQILADEAVPNGE
jgi:curved DNA-binding protein CbpA